MILHSVPGCFLRNALTRGVAKSTHTTDSLLCLIFLKLLRVVNCISQGMLKWSEYIFQVGQWQSTGSYITLDNIGIRCGKNACGIRIDMRMLASHNSRHVWWFIKKTWARYIYLSMYFISKYILLHLRSKTKHSEVCSMYYALMTLKSQTCNE